MKSYMNFFESSMNKMNLIFIRHEESYSNTNHNTMLQQKKTSIAKVSHYRRHLSLKHSSIKKRRTNSVIHVAIRLLLGRCRYKTTYSLASLSLFLSLSSHSSLIVSVVVLL